MKKLEVNKVYIGNCLDVLQTFPDESIDMCITSPPYWGLRDYGVDNQLGLEETPEEFVDKLCDVFDEVKRVLRPHGSCWVNLGDSYCRTPNSQDKSGKTGITTHKYDYDFKHKKSYSDAYKPKSLVQIPSRFAIEMTNRGWILRNEIIWHKPSCLPASVKDRYTVDFEKMFFFTKNPKYYFKQQIEPVKEKSLERAQYGINQTDNSQKAVNVQNMKKMGTRFVNPNGRNKRTVWNVNTAKLRDAHFAVYPPELLESPIDAGCPRLVDKVTKKPREVVLEKSFGNPVESVDHKSQNAEDWRKIGKSRMNKGKYPTGAQYVEKGYTDNRDDSEFEPGIVLDPFFGSGTTAQVAMEQDKDWVGIELNPDYEKISQKRLKPKIVEKKTRDLANKFWDTK